MIDVGIIGAFLGGLLSFVSPCVLPLVPPYLCYIAGVSVEEFAQRESESKRRRDIVLAALSFVLGFSTVFVALGATALEGLLGLRGIQRLRGQWRLYQGQIPVMPTFHPAYLLREPSAKRLVWNDLKLVLDHLGLSVPERR